MFLMFWVPHKGRPVVIFEDIAAAFSSGSPLLQGAIVVAVLGILFLRQDHGLHIIFGSHAIAGETMVFLARLLTVQVVFLMLGLLVMRRQGYFNDFVFGSKTSPGSYALVCPAVALSVMLHFFINKGLVSAGVVDKISFAYWGLTAFALTSTAIAVALILRLNRQHFSAHSAAPNMVPGE